MAGTAAPSAEVRCNTYEKARDKKSQREGGHERQHSHEKTLGTHDATKAPPEFLGPKCVLFHFILLRGSSKVKYLALRGNGIPGERPPGIVATPADFDYNQRFKCET